MYNEGSLKAMNTKLWRHKLFLIFCQTYLPRKNFQGFFFPETLNDRL